MRSFNARRAAARSAAACLTLLMSVGDLGAQTLSGASVSGTSVSGAYGESDGSAGKASAGIGGAQAEVQERLLGGHSVLGASRDWTAISYRDEEGRIWCAAYTTAGAAETVRGDRTLFVSYPAGAPDDAFVTAMLGAPSGRAVAALSIDGAVSLDMFLDGDRLFSFPEDDDAAMAALRRGRSASVTVSGEMSGDAPTMRDEYSLMGLTRSMAILGEFCVKKQDIATR